MRTYGRGGIPEDPTRCIEDVSDGGTWPTYHQCHRKRGYGPNGEYCKQHDPDAVKAKRDAEDAKWRHKMDKESKARRRLQAMTAYCADLSTEYMETHKAKEERE